MSISKTMHTLNTHNSSFQFDQKGKDNQTQLNSDLSSQLTQPHSSQIKQSLYKTEMCKNWEKSKTCPYKTKCKFAHGKEELQMKDKEKDPNYKRKDCLGFFKYWNCSYGRRCCNKHDERKFNELVDNEITVMIMMKLVNPNQVLKRSLPVFEELNSVSSLENRNIHKKISFSDSEDADSESTIESSLYVGIENEENVRKGSCGRKKSKCDLYAFVERKASNQLNLYDYVEE